MHLLQPVCKVLYVSHFVLFFFFRQKFQINDTPSVFDRCRLRQLDDCLCEQVVTK